MSHRPYSTDLTDEQWAIVAPLLPLPRPRGRRPTADRRRVLDAILYQTKNACTWRDLPRDFPNHTTVYRYFARWRDDGTLATVYEALHRRWHREVGRDENPGVVDSPHGTRPLLDGSVTVRTKAPDNTHAHLMRVKDNAPAERFGEDV
ncbi:MAG: transposase [Bacteroidota bacterium]